MKAGRASVLFACLVFYCLFSIQPSQAQTLYGALTSTYNTNPTLKAAQQQALSTNETYRQAFGNALPTVTGTGTLGYSDVRTRPVGGRNTQNSTNIVSLGVTVNQPLYRGGGISAGLRNTENNIQSQWYQLQSVEQNVLAQAVQAYMNVIRDREILRSTRHNVDVLSNQLSAAQTRYDVGEGTRSDIALAQSALAASQANVAAASGALESSRTVFIQIIGQTPSTLNEPGIPSNVPYSLEEAQRRAEANDPLVIAALYIEKAAYELVEVRKAAMLPSADLQGSFTANWDGAQSGDIVSQDARVFAQLSVPLYQGGRAVSQLRSAKHDLNRAIIQVDEQRRRARQAAASAWYTYQSTQNVIPARVAQLDAARVAQDGVKAEYDVGTKTILDVLQAEQQTLEASVALTQARVDRVVAAYSLVAASGDLTAVLLGLPVQHFDIRKHYKTIKEQRFTFGLGY